MIVMTLLTGLPAAAQDSDQAKPKEQPRASAPATPEAQPVIPQAPRPPEGAPVNVRVELTITDTRGDGTPISKTVTLIAADRSPSRIRTSADVRTATGIRPVILNVDARPMIVRDGSRDNPQNYTKLRLELTIEYRPLAAEAETEKNVTSPINESLAVILEDGKPLLVSQSADPTSDRKVTVEAKATILR
jgi:hypothetical protein